MKHIILPIMIFVLTVLLSSPSYAQPHFLLAQSGSQTLNDATQSIKQKTGGRILSTKTVKSNGQTIYKIKVLLPSGKIQTFKVSAQ